MNNKILITACCLFILLGTISAQEAQLEKAFAVISKLNGFKTYYKEQQLINGWGADNHLDCFSEVTTISNADSQEQLLSILETIPKELLVNDIRVVRDDQKTKSLVVEFIEYVPRVYCDEIGVYCDETFILLCSAYVYEGSYETRVTLYKGCGK